MRFPATLLILLTILSTLTGVGCSRANHCPTGKTCIRYMAWGNPEQLDVEREFVAKFNKENPDLHVKLFTVPASSYGTKMTTMLVAGTAPDVLRVDNYGFSAMQKRGLFKELNAFADSDPTFKRSDFNPGTIEEGTVDGRLYGLNVLYGGIIIYYNKTLYRNAGLKDPFERYVEGTWTWDQYLADAKALTQRDGRRALVFGSEVISHPSTFTLLWAHGCDVFDPETNQSKLSQPGCTAGYQFLRDLIWRHKVAPTAAQSANAAYTFESGKIGLQLNFMGQAPRYRTVIKDFEWDICPVPRGPVGGRTLVKGNQLVIAKNSKAPEAAWRFIRYMTGEETEQKLYSDIRRGFPSRRSVSESWRFLESDLPPFNMRSMTDSVATGKFLPINDRWSEWTQIQNAEVDNLLAGRETDVAAVLKRAESRINRALAEEPGF